MEFEKEMIRAKVAGVYISKNPDPLYKGEDYMVCKPVEELRLDIQGIQGDRHYGFEAKAGGRCKRLYQRGQVFRNNRQWSAIAREEIDAIDHKLNLGGKLSADMLGINILVEGVPKLSELPLNGGLKYVVISPHQDEYLPGRPEDVVLVSYAQMIPCAVQGKALVHPYQDISLESRFPKAAMAEGKISQRGIAGWVEKGGIIKPGNLIWILSANGRD